MNEDKHQSGLISAFLTFPIFTNGKVESDQSKAQWNLRRL